MSTYEPGTVAVATVRGMPDVRVFRWVDVYGHLRWDSANLVGNECTHLDEQIRDIHPLVVIDPEDREQVERLCSAHPWMGTNEQVVGDMQAALREFANPTPPKPAEPTGLGAVVEDADALRWVRVDGDDYPWFAPDSRDFSAYKAITAVRVLSEGVAS